jgi:dynein heavy chain
MKLEDVIILSAMGPPGGARTTITNRIIRHFNIIGYTELNDSTINHIFITLVDHFFKRYNDSVKELNQTLVDSVLFTYNSVKRDLLPTPSKSHYTFNMRDIWKVF